jgi:hypothetical protein
VSRPDGSAVPARPAEDAEKAKSTPPRVVTRLFHMLRGRRRSVSVGLPSLAKSPEDLSGRFFLSMPGSQTESGVMQHPIMRSKHEQTSHIESCNTLKFCSNIQHPSGEKLRHQLDGDVPFGQTAIGLVWYS